MSILPPQLATFGTSLPASAIERDPRALLEWLLERIAPRRVVLASSLGPQSLVVIDLLHELRARVDVAFLDTELHFRETYELLERVERRYGLRIRRVQSQMSLAEQARRCGPRLWERDCDLCCALRKVEPMRALLAEYEAWITGVRRSSAATRSHTPVFGWDELHELWKLNPLAHWSREDVEEYAREHELPRHALLDQGFASIGCAPCSSPRSADDRDERSGRWRGRGKTECGLHAR